MTKPKPNKNKHKKLRYIVRYISKNPNLNHKEYSGIHDKPDEYTDHEFRLNLLKEYIFRNKKVLWIDSVYVNKNP